MTGTVLIHGKQYKTVACRVSEFRQKYRVEDGWGIKTDLIEHNENVVLMKAVIVNPQGAVIAIGHAEEKRTGRINMTSAIENCETSAIGRALSVCGFAGSEFASADEVARAIQQQNQIQNKQQTYTPPKEEQATQEQIAEIKELCGALGYTEQEKAKLRSKYGANGSVTAKQAKNILLELRKEEENKDTWNFYRTKNSLPDLAEEKPFNYYLPDSFLPLNLVGEKITAEQMATDDKIRWKKVRGGEQKARAFFHFKTSSRVSGEAEFAKAVLEAYPSQKEAKQQEMEVATA
jgi:hypothetical protein